MLTLRSSRRNPIISLHCHFDLISSKFQTTFKSPGFFYLSVHLILWHLEPFAVHRKQSIELQLYGDE
ncbi:unnamed protein product [Lactuca virosa]|uniref:Uncharacterized protein n=1 Tax=Lactuca virosa TaxID=75947 RepID=A0AAU9M6P0_9ASTR|nr:unnamed protein product [Lactuca virosa]